MPRPTKCRRVTTRPDVTYFKPRGIPMRDLEEVFLALDGLEAIRLADLEGLTHAEAAERMAVSRQTFGRILTEAHRIVAEALVSGIALRVAGGCVAVQDDFTASAATQTNRAPSPRPELAMTRVAITCEGPTLEDPLDPRFGRAAGFLIVDTTSEEITYLDNGAGQQLSQGAGIQAAKILADHGVGALLTGYVGPKAFTALSAAGIRVAQGLESMTAREALDRFTAGTLDWATAPNRQGHGH